VPADLETVVGFNIAMALETEGKSLEKGRVHQGVKAVLNSDRLGIYLLAEINHRVVGQLLITTEWSDWRNGYFWWVQSVYVVPDCRRHGVYRALDRQVRTEALREGNVCGLRLYVDRDNHIAQLAYESLGMAPSNYKMYEIEFG
jgi:GNAT superfamily N-acetyltransferase